MRAAASRTAVLVCQGRAAAQRRLAVGLFDDPVAARLLRPDELVPVEQVRRGKPPRATRERLRYESVRACAAIMAPRTVAIDEAVVAAAAPQLVVVGAGLDSRAWRMQGLAGTTAYLVDRAASLADAEDRRSGLVPVVGRLVPVPADLAEVDLRMALRAAGHDAERPTTWVWEGVVPYLTRKQVRATVAAIADRSAPGSTLLVNYQVPSMASATWRRVGRLVARVTGADDPLRGEPWRSAWTPRQMHDLLRGSGFAVEEDDDLLVLARRYGSPDGDRRALTSGRVARAVRT